jgi:hypothetical protein
MSDHGPIFQVTVDARGVVLEKLKRKHPGYRRARKRAVLRQRDAIELFRKLKSRKALDGAYAFHFLETARTFAILRLQAQQGDLEANLDRVLAYDGGAKRSDD